MLIVLVFSIKMESNFGLVGNRRLQVFIERHIHPFISRMLRQYKIVLITGPRQVGKTYLIREKYLNDYEYTVLDDYNALEMAKTDPALFFRNHPVPLIVDEVQRAPELFLQMKLLADGSAKKGQFILTGSQSYRLLENASDSLAGRVCIIDMSSLSMREKKSVDFNEPFIPTSEYLESRRCKLTEYDEIWEHIFRGSMPELRDSEIDWEPFYRSYVRTYMDRDVAGLISTSNLLKFNIFMKCIAARTGELFNAQSIAEDVGVSGKTIQEWTSILEASGVIFLLHPYSSNITNRAIKTPKVYFTDTGLVCYLVGWSNSKVAMNGAMSGALFETFVISEIAKSYLNAGHDTSRLYFYRDKDKKEIDLIVEKDNVLYPVEIKKSAHPSIDMARSFNALSGISGKQVGHGCILCQTTQKHDLSNQVSAVPIEFI